MKALLLVLLLFLSEFCQGQNVEGLFETSKIAYLKFEKEHGNFIQTPRVKLHYLSWGDPTHKPLIWVHGSYSNAYEFYSFANSLSKEGYFIIAIDYFGHGLTPIPAKSYTIYDLADDIKFLLDFLKIKKTIIGGWSRGASIATAFYDSYPELVSGIILEDGGSVPWLTKDHQVPVDSLPAIFENIGQGFPQNDAEPYESQISAVSNLTDFTDEGRAFFSFAAVKQLPSGKWIDNPELAKYMGEESVKDILKLIYEPFGSPHVFSASTVLLNPPIVYRNLNVPVLLLDPISDPDPFPFEKANAKLKEDHLELITHRIYPNTSHGLKFQRPEEFLKDLRSFLGSVNY